MLTVKEILELDVMDPSILHTNRSNLHQPVEWVSIIEPPVENFVRRNELVLTTGIGIGNDVEKMIQFIEEISEAEAAALIFSTGRYMYSIPDKVIQQADARELPIIELPWEIRFSDVTQEVSRALHSLERKTVAQSEKIRKDLLDLVLTGGDLSDISRYVHISLGAPVMIVDKRGQTLGKGGQTNVLEQKWQNYLSETVDPYSLYEEDSNDTTYSLSNMQWLSSPCHNVLQLLIQSAREIQGAMLVEWPEDENHYNLLEEERLILLEHAVTTAALCFLHHQAVLETEMRLKDDFVWSLAKGRFTNNWDQALSRAKSLGYVLNLPYICFIGRPENLQSLFEEDGANHASFEHWLKQIGELLEEEVYHTGRTMDAKTMCTFQREDLVVFIEVPSASRSMETTFRFLDLLQYRMEQKLPRLKISWGVAKTVGTDNFHDSFQEARTALDIGRRQKGHGFISTYADTRFDRALLALMDNEEIRQLTEITMAPLERYSTERGIDLIHTFNIYNRQRGNVSKTARTLNLHRQSLIYRLRKIESLTGCNLDDPDDLFLIDLSMRLYQLGHRVPLSQEQQ